MTPEFRQRVMERTLVLLTNSTSLDVGLIDDLFGTRTVKNLSTGNSAYESQDYKDVKKSPWYSLAKR